MYYHLRKNFPFATSLVLMNALMMDFIDRYNHDASINKRGLDADLANFYDMHQIEGMKLLAYELGHEPLFPQVPMVTHFLKTPVNDLELLM